MCGRRRLIIPSSADHCDCKPGLLGSDIVLSVQYVAFLKDHPEIQKNKSHPQKNYDLSRR